MFLSRRCFCGAIVFLYAKKFFRAHDAGDIVYLIPQYRFSDYRKKIKVCLFLKSEVKTFDKDAAM